MVFVFFDQENMLTLQSGGSTFYMILFLSRVESQKIHVFAGGAYCLSSNLVLEIDTLLNAAN